MPDLSSPNVPKLRARVHRRLSPDLCSRVGLSDLTFRALQPEDYDEMVALHTEWFPVAYDDAFYTKSVHGDIFTLAAVYNWPEMPAAANGSSADGPDFTGTSSPASSSSAPPPVSVGNGASSASNTSCAAPVADGTSTCENAPEQASSHHDLLGIVTMSTNCEHHADDIVHILGADCATICGKKSSISKDLDNVEDPLMAGERSSSGKGGALAYILTLGIVDQYRRRGLARELLQQSISYVDTHYPKVQAVYLHVVTYNAAAIQLYESMRFVRVGHFPSFYQLHGKPYDSYLYARYLHDGRPCWKIRLKNWLGLGASSSWTEWFMALPPWGNLWNSNEKSDSTCVRPPDTEVEHVNRDGLAIP